VEINYIYHYGQMLIQVWLCSSL